MSAAPQMASSTARQISRNWSLPNILTYARVAAVPLVAAFLFWPDEPWARWTALAIFIAAGVSDFFDGYLARSYDYVTTLGKFLDPMADKLVVTTALIMLAGMARSPHVPAWMVVVLVTREIMVTGLRAVAAAEGLIVGAEELGKYKMTLQAIAIHGLLIHYTYLHVDFFAAGMFILWLAMGVSVWSGADYYVRVVRELRPKPVVAAAGKRAVI